MTVLIHELPRRYENLKTFRQPAKQFAQFLVHSE